jgi:predicted DCC family thiol-disulfide oxidoreductase YuxK
MERATVLYDLDCGFCRWALAAVLAWDRRERLRPVAIQDAEAGELLADVDPAARLASWHLVTAAGSRHSAGAAVPELLRVLPGGGPLAAVAAALSPITNRGYDLLAGRRSLPGRVLPSSAVRRATERIGARSAPTSLIQRQRAAARGAPTPPGARPAPPQGC